MKLKTSLILLALSWLLIIGWQIVAGVVLGWTAVASQPWWTTINAILVSASVAAIINVAIAFQRHSTKEKNQ